MYENVHGALLLSSRVENDTALSQLDDQWIWLGISHESYITTGREWHRPIHETSKRHHNEKCVRVCVLHAHENALLIFE
jgi:hypothetical protein